MNKPILKPQTGFTKLPFTKLQKLKVAQPIGRKVTDPRSRMFEGTDKVPADWSPSLMK